MSNLVNIYETQFGFENINTPAITKIGTKYQQNCSLKDF